LTSKQDKNAHGVLDDPEFDVGNFKFHSANSNIACTLGYIYSDKGETLSTTWMYEFPRK